MSVKIQKVGEHKGKDVYSYLLDNENSLKAEIFNLGGIVKRIIFKDTDVALGYETPADYISGDTYFGALIGRNSNRIAKGEFYLNGEKIKVSVNNGENNLHGGFEGFDKKVWDAKVMDKDEPALRLSLVSPDREEGFPGKVKVAVTYTVTKENELKIQYEATTNKDTLFNMTNHTYFNLNGHSSGAVSGHKVWIDADFYNPSYENCMPTGEILRVDETPYDLRDGSVLSDCFNADYYQIKLIGGFDNNFVLNGEGLRLAGAAMGDKSGIKMEVYTDKPAMQLYTGNQIKKDTAGKDGVLYDMYGGFCFETQGFPGSANYKHFPDSILRKGEKEDSVTIYRFI